MTNNLPGIDSAIQSIAKAILHDECILICGSDLSAINGRQPNNRDIVKHFIDDYWKEQSPTSLEQHNIENLLNKSLQEVAQLYFDSINGRDIKYIVDRINDNFLDKCISSDSSPSTTHLLLVSLGIKDIYTTNYDELIENAFKVVGFRQINVISRKNFGQLNNMGLPNIYKLCGTVKDKNTILIKSQFSKTNLDLNSLHYPFMRQIFKKTIVFIGYNNQDNTILESYVDFIKKCEPRKCYCVLPNTFEEKEIESLNSLEGLQYINMPIEKFIFRLRIASLSTMLNSFNYLSNMRKTVESYGINTLIDELRDCKDEDRCSRKIKAIGIMLKQQEEHYSSEGNTWYDDYRFHYSFYNQLQNKLFVEDFSKYYLKLRTFYSTYQTESAIDDHRKILKNLTDRSWQKTRQSLVDHLGYVTDDAYFWLSYIRKLCESKLFIDSLYEDQIFIENDRGDIFPSKLDKKGFLFGLESSVRTTVAKREVLLAFAKGDAIPIYIDCESSSNVMALFNKPQFIDFLIHYFFDIWQLASEGKKIIIEQRIKSGKILLIIDGFDRLPSGNHQFIAERIQHYDNEVNNPSMKILITSQTEFKGLQGFLYKDLSPSIGGDDLVETIDQPNSNPPSQTPSQTIIQNFHGPVYGVAANVHGNLQINPDSATTEIDKTPNP